MDIDEQPGPSTQHAEHIERPATPTDEATPMDVDGPVTGQESLAGYSNEDGQTIMDSPKTLHYRNDNHVTTDGSTTNDHDSGAGGCCYTDSHVSLCPGAAEQTDQPLPNTSACKQPISLFNKHQLPATETRSDAADVGNSIFKWLQTNEDLAATRHGTDRSGSVHNDINRGGADDNPDSTSSTTILSDPADPTTSMEGRRTPLVFAHMSAPEGGLATGTSEEDETDGGIISVANRTYHTFILHTRNLLTGWRGQIAKARGVLPSFLLFDHGDHVHLLYSSRSGGGNPARSRDRIVRFLHASDAGTAEAVITNIKIRNIRKFLLYCVRKGISSAHSWKYVTNRAAAPLRPLPAAPNNHEPG